MTFIVDASTVVSWLIEDEATDSGRMLLDRLETEGAHAPAILALEIANALRSAERSRRLTRAAADDAAGLVQALSITLHPTDFSVALGPILELMRAHKLTAYDAAYLSLSIDTRLPIATFDRALRKAATSAGLTLLPA